MEDLARIRQLIADSFAGEPWYGPAVMDVVGEITPAQASASMGVSHTILQLVQHMTAWRRFVTAKLTGSGYDVSEAANFPTGGDWYEVVQQLEESQGALLNALHEFPAARMQDTVPGRNYDFTYMLFGIVQHDIYHLGQIAQLRKTKQL